MVAVAAHSRFSSPAGMRLAGKFVSNSMNGMLGGERDLKTATAPRAAGVPARGRGAGHWGAGRATAKLLIGQVATALLDWLPGLLLFCNHARWLQITEVVASGPLALPGQQGALFQPQLNTLDVYVSIGHFTLPGWLKVT